MRAESLLTKMATARLYTLTLPPTETCQIVQFTPLRSVYHHNLCSEAPRPPAQVTGCPFLIKAAELKRFRTHSLRMYTLSIQRWVGGRSSKLRAESLLTKMATARLYTLTLPPTETCQIVQFTPLRSVYHHNLCSEAPRPPAQVTGCPFLIKAAELKRFRTHSLRMYTLSIQRWVGGRSSKLRAESLLTKMATARLYTLTLPPTETCQIVQFTPLRSVYHKNNNF